MGGAIGLWVAAEWRRHWPALLSLAALVAVAGGTATALAAGARRADSAYTRFQTVTSAPNMIVELDFEQSEGSPTEPIDLVDELDAIDGVDGVKVESWWAISQLPGADPPGVVAAFAVGPAATAGRINEPLVIDGALPDVDDPDAVVINEEAARQLDVGVGGVITFRTASPARLSEWADNDGEFESAEALDGPTVDVVVAAIVRADEDLGEERFPNVTFAEGFARAHRADIAHLEPAVLLRVDPARFDAVADDVESLLAPFGAIASVMPDIGEAIRPSVRVQVTTLWVAVGVATVAGLLVVAQSFARRITVVAAEHGARRAIGMTRTDLTIGAAAGCAPAILAGAAVVPFVAWAWSWAFPRGVARLAEAQPGLRWDPTALVLGAVATAVVVGVVAFALAAYAARPGDAGAPVRTRWTARTIGHPALSLGASFAADPSGGGQRARTLAATTAASVAFGVAAVIAVATLEGSRDHVVDSPRLFGAPGALVYESNGTLGVETVIDEALELEGVTELTRHVEMDDDSTTMLATGPRGSAYVVPASYEPQRGGARPAVVDGRYPAGPDEVAVGGATARDLGVEVGESVTVGAEPDATRLRVTGRVVSWSSDDAEHGFVVAPDTLRALVCPSGELEACNVSIDVFATADAGASTELEARGFDRVPPPANVFRLGQVGAIPWYLSSFLCLLGAAAVLHAVVTSGRRRRRDLAVLRALGLPAKSAAASLSWQAALIGAVGAVAGIALGVIAGPLLWRLIGEDVGVVIAPQLSLTAVVGGALGALATCGVVSLVPRWRAGRTPVAEALRSE
jgi:ABC-type lipoprotein release transport system permease subunit